MRKLLQGFRVQGSGFRVFGLPYTPYPAPYTLFFLFSFLLSPFSFSLAHWADLAAAEISTTDKTTQIILTFPTGLIVEMDTNADSQLSEAEFHLHHMELTNYFLERIHLSDARGQKPTITIAPVNTAVSTSSGIAPGTHTTVKLLYTWKQEPADITIDYNVFLPGVSTASCLATILQDKTSQAFVFTPVDHVLKIETPRDPSLLERISSRISRTILLMLVGVLALIAWAYIFASQRASGKVSSTQSH